MALASRQPSQCTLSTLFGGYAQPAAIDDRGESMHALTWFTGRRPAARSAALVVAGLLIANSVLVG